MRERTGWTVLIEYPESDKWVTEWRIMVTQKDQKEGSQGQGDNSAKPVQENNKRVGKKWTHLRNSHRVQQAGSNDFLYVCDKKKSNGDLIT